ncbi:MAG: hypothetical protein WCK52_11595 [Betaproteobacteria bacterium]
MSAFIYNSKLPPKILQPLLEFSQSNECFLIPRNLDRSVFNTEFECHGNVSAQVKTESGKQIFGWALVRNKKLFRKGIWVFSFHSVWLCPEGHLIDITIDMENPEDFTVFIPDSTRSVDLVKGITYHDLFITEEFAPVAPKLVAKYNLRPHKLYWSLNNLTGFQSLESSNGQAYLLNGLYLENEEKLFQEYSVKVVNGELISSIKENRDLTKMHYEYLLNLKKPLAMLYLPTGKVSIFSLGIENTINFESFHQTINCLVSYI